MSGILSVGGAGNVGGGDFYSYSIDQSLRFDDNDSASLSNASFSTPTDNQNWTWSAWIKLSTISTDIKVLFQADTSSVDVLQIADHKLSVTINGATTTTTSMLLRDPAAYYHIVWNYDGSNSKLYVNGELQVTVAKTGNTKINNASYTHYIGTNSTARYFDGYMAEVNFIDGTALDATSFGETINGIWVPKAYDTADGVYGTNGFYLSFADSSAIGDDLSGNGNDWTANNQFAYNVVPDGPTNNFCTLNPLDQEQQGANVNEYRRGNLDVKSAGNTGLGKTRATFAIPTSGKWYWEMRCTNTSGQAMGILNSSEDLDNTSGFDSFAEGYSYKNNGEIKNNGTSVAYGDSWTNLDNIGVLVDADAGEIFFYKNGTIQNSGTAAFTGLDMTNNFMPIWADRTPSANGRAIFNFGQDSTFYGSETAGGNSDANGNGDFQYTVPTGALAICSANLPEVTIGPNSAEQADDYFNTLLYSGDGTTSRSITGVGFAPDFVWGKCRTNAEDNILSDTVRGANKKLESNNTGAEDTSTAATLSGFESDGFTGPSSTPGNINVSGRTYVAWNWKAGGTAVSNTDGSITSSVSAAPDAGFSIVSYTGTGANATVGHGLSSAPEMVIVKRRDSTGDWLVWNLYVAVTGSDKVLFLNTTDAQTVSATNFNSSSPTDSVINIGTNPATNASSGTHIAYCFHSVEGFSKVGKYVGNGNEDGTFVYTGFDVKWVMTKEVDATSNWFINDTSRDPFNVADNPLAADETTAEPVSSIQDIDFLSNGFKIRNNGGGRNTNGNTYIYLAIGGPPQKYSNAR